MKYALFLGCTIPARARNYELSARRVAEKTGIELVDMENFICCGFPTKAGDMQASLLMAAYNLALAQQQNLDVCALCSSCTSALSEAAHHLSENGEDLARVNEQLAKVGLQYEGSPKIRHFARVLFEEVGEEKIRAQFEKDLSGLNIASHYGCHYLKPSEIHGGFDDPENPNSLETLVALTGATVVDYAGKKTCCGGPVLPVDEKLAMQVTRGKLDNLKEAGADALCLVCPFCSVMYDGNQKSIEKEYEIEYKIPVLYLTQILGMAMGFDRKALGLNMNVVKTKNLLKPYF
jgi:heterodisulfide reductase subunit B2